jgi:hypothetical protein
VFFAGSSTIRTELRIISFTKVRAQKELLLGAVKSGDADCAYAFLGGGGFSIQNANSAEDLNQRMMGSPLALFYEFDVRALTDYGKFMDTVAQALEKQKH